MNNVNWELIQMILENGGKYYSAHLSYEEVLEKFPQYANYITRKGFGVEIDTWKK